MSARKKSVVLDLIPKTAGASHERVSLRTFSSLSVEDVVTSSGSMIVVSNRLPFVLQRDKSGNLIRKASAGGLVTAVAPVVINGNGLWVGWPGIHLENKDEPIPESDPSDITPTAGLKSDKVVAVQIDPDIFDSYYNGCCNGTFWPLFHSMPDRTTFSGEHWKNYVIANKEFADCTMKALRSLPKASSNQVPLVWVHDYHLMLAANYIRQDAEDENIACKLGFFLHIPFPPWDIFRLFPWSDEILQGMLACDMVGFHITDYCLNFVDCCQRNLGCRVDRKNLLVEHGGRTVRVRPLPIGIPFERFVELAEKAPKVFSTNQKIILGVDRLDYTKGLVHRLKAFEKLLEKHPEHIEKVSLLQIAVPSRTDVKEYQELKEEMDQLVGRINGKFTTPNWSPIRYIYGCVSQDELAAFYRDSAVGLVTPLRDGMNLVAKEFVACQINIPPGVLIVSPFAGAGETMHEALICNPYEIDNASEVIHRALTMPEDERILRMNYLRRREKLNDVNYWTKSFLSAMGSLVTQEDYDDIGSITMPAVTLDDFDEYLAKYIGNSLKLALLLDYDGTLAPIAPHPDLAVIPPETKNVLQRLSNLPDCYIAIVSGRNVMNVKEMVGIEGITYAGNHGLEILHPDGTKFVHPMPTEFHNKVGELMRQLQEKVCRDGAWVENKGPLLTFHFRETPVHLRVALEEKARELIEASGFKACEAHCAIEAKPPVQWNKGRASIYILRTAFGVDWSERVRIIYAGDDATDEDAMQALKGMAATFRVTSSHITKTSAERRLPSTDSVLTLLKWVERHLSRRKPSLDPNSYRRNSLAKQAAVQIEMSMIPPGSPPGSNISLLQSKISSMAFHQKYIESFDFALLRYLDDTKELALLLDYDGTLSPLVAHPDLAVLPEKTKIVLDRLSKTPNVFIAIISGRAVHSVKEKVGLDNITYAGNHGIEILYPDGTSYHHPVPEDIKNKFELMSRELEDKLTVYGAWVENKGATLTYHYRSVPEDQKQEIAEQAKAIMEKYGFQVNMAHEAIEVKPPVKWNKGYAAEYILENTFGVDWDSNVTAIFAGDDTTDEDAMKALKGRGLSFRISNNPDVITHADYLLQSTDSVFKMLEWILNYLTNKDQD